MGSGASSRETYQIEYLPRAHSSTAPNSSSASTSSLRQSLTRRSSKSELSGKRRRRSGRSSSSLKLQKSHTMKSRSVSVHNSGCFQANFSRNDFIIYGKASKAILGQGFISRCVCVCICVYVCMYVCVYVCMYVCMHGCMDV